MEVLRLLELVRARRVAGHGKLLHLGHRRVLRVARLDLDELSERRGRVEVAVAVAGDDGSRVDRGLEGLEAERGGMHADSELVSDERAGAGGVGLPAGAPLGDDLGHPGGGPQGGLEEKY